MSQVPGTPQPVDCSSIHATSIIIEVIEAEDSGKHLTSYFSRASSRHDCLLPPTSLSRERSTRSTRSTIPGVKGPTHLDYQGQQSQWEADRLVWEERPCGCDVVPWVVPSSLRWLMPLTGYLHTPRRQTNLEGREMWRCGRCRVPRFRCSLWAVCDCLYVTRHFARAFRLSLPQRDSLTGVRVQVDVIVQEGQSLFASTFGARQALRATIEGQPSLA